MCIIFIKLVSQMEHYLTIWFNTGNLFPYSMVQCCIFHLNLIKAMLKLKFSDKVKVLDASRTTTNNYVYFTVREWLTKCILETEQDIDCLFKYYAANISVDLMEVLEAIPRSTYHAAMRTLLTSPSDVNFSEAASSPDGNFFFKYYDLIKKLKQIQQRDYS